MRPADLLLRAWQGGRDTAVDFTVTHPLQENQKPGGRVKADHFLKAAEARKVGKYRAPCEAEGWAFILAVFDTWGGTEP